MYLACDGYYKSDTVNGFGYWGKHWIWIKFDRHQSPQLGHTAGLEEEQFTAHAYEAISVKYTIEPLKTS